MFFLSLWGSRACLCLLIMWLPVEKNKNMLTSSNFFDSLTRLLHFQTVQSVRTCLFFKLLWYFLFHKTIVWLLTVEQLKPVRPLPDTLPVLHCISPPSGTGKNTFLSQWQPFQNELRFLDRLPRACGFIYLFILLLHFCYSDQGRNVQCDVITAFLYL